MAHVNEVDLAQNDLTAYVVKINQTKNVTVGVTTGANNAAGAVVRIDGSWGGNIWKVGISLSDPAGAVGAAFVNALTGPSQVAETQDRLFGAEAYRIVRTDGTGGVCKVYTSARMNG